MTTFPNGDSKSAAMFERACAVMPGGNSRSTLYYPPYPVYVVAGRGSQAIDADGVARTDFINCYSASIHGHCHPEIIAAASAQLNTLVSVAAPTDVEVELAEALVARIPSFETMRFCNSGTEAVMQTIKAARAFTGKPRIAKVEGTYHGTYETAEVSQNSLPHNWGELSAPTPTATAAGTPDAVLNGVAILSMNRIDHSLATLNHHKNELAAVLLDPLPSRMGFMPMSAAYASAIRQWCTEHDVILIFDEVMSLRGGYHGMQGELGVTPDLTATGKIIGGGFPIGAFGGRADVMAVFDATLEGGARVSHGGTFNAHPVSMAAGLASLRLLDQQAMAHLASLGARARAGLDQAIHDAGLPGRACGYGSLIGLQFSEQEVTSYRDLMAAKAPAGLLESLFHHWLNNGVLAMPRGGMLLSTVMTEAEIDAMTEQAAIALRAFA